MVVIFVLVIYLTVALDTPVIFQCLQMVDVLEIYALDLVII